MDLSAFQIFDLSGPGVVPYLERLTVNKCDRPVGGSIYTPLLTPDGGIRADLTIQRLAADRFRVVTGAFDGARDEVWFRRHLPDRRLPCSSRTCLPRCARSVCGGRSAPALLAGIADTGLSQEEFPYGTVREALIDGVPVTMLRISYVGESGWEISTAHAARSAPVGCTMASGPPVRRPPGRHRRLRHHRTHGEGLPADGIRPHGRVLPHGSGPGPATREAGRLHRQAGLPAGARRPGRPATDVRADHGPTTPARPASTASQPAATSRF